MNTLMIRDVKIGEGAPKVIVPLVGKTEEELLEEAMLIKSSQPDLVEWRVDFFDKVEELSEVENIARQLRNSLEDIPLIFTFRTAKEGGAKELSEDDYRQLNLTAIKSGNLDLIDVELFSTKETIETLLPAAKEHGVYVIMSNHEFSFTPAKDVIMDRLLQMQAYGADIVKMAVMPLSVGDVLTLLDATNTMKVQHGEKPVVTMAMGRLGLITRLSGEVFGSALTFASGKEASAPGQIPVGELRTALEILHKNML